MQAADDPWIESRANKPKLATCVAAKTSWDSATHSRFSFGTEDDDYEQPVIRPQAASTPISKLLRTDGNVLPSVSSCHRYPRNVAALRDLDSSTALVDRWVRPAWQATEIRPAPPNRPLRTNAVGQLSAPWS